jgi:hypothetical protein
VTGFRKSGIDGCLVAQRPDVAGVVRRDVVQRGAPFAFVPSVTAGSTS